MPIYFFIKNLKNMLTFVNILHSIYSKERVRIIKGDDGMNSYTTNLINKNLKLREITKEQVEESQNFRSVPIEVKQKFYNLYNDLHNKTQMILRYLELKETLDDKEEWEMVYDIWSESFKIYDDFVYDILIELYGVE